EETAESLRVPSRSAAYEKVLVRQRDRRPGHRAGLRKKDCGGNGAHMGFGARGVARVHRECLARRSGEARRAVLLGRIQWVRHGRGANRTHRLAREIGPARPPSERVALWGLSRLGSQRFFFWWRLTNS